MAQRKSSLRLTTSTPESRLSGAHQARRHRRSTRKVPASTRPATDNRPLCQEEAITDFHGSRRTVTQSIESEASRDEVVGVLAEATRIPEWAPAFVDRVTGDARSGWLATKDGQDFALRVMVDQGAGTVDYLREVGPGREGGAYLRAVPRPGGGSVIAMTLPLLPGVNPTDTAATLAQELDALAALVERH